MVWEPQKKQHQLFRTVTQEAMYLAGLLRSLLGLFNTPKKGLLVMFQVKLMVYFNHYCRQLVKREQMQF